MNYCHKDFHLEHGSFQAKTAAHIREETLSMQEEGGGFFKFLKKTFLTQETIDLNISWHSNFFGEYFMAPLINFSFLFKAYL